MTAATRSILVASGDKAMAEGVRGLIEDYKRAGRAEFNSIEVREVQGTAGQTATEGVVAAVVDGDSLPEVLRVLAGLFPVPPVFVALPSFTAAGVAAAYSHDYPEVRGVIRTASLLDPLERGLFADALLEAVCSNPVIRSGLSDFAVGSRIPADPEGRDHEQRRFVSLLLDRRMRIFVQELTYAVTRVSSVKEAMPPAPDEGVINSLYEKLDKAKRADPAEKEKLLKEARRGFKPYLDAPKPDVRPAAILLEGETGTGKSVIAHWISSRLTGKPPVHVSMVNLPEKLLEAELFGSVYGDYTDAVTRPGQLHLGYGRVVFLDEIGDARADVQAKMLIYLDTFAFRPGAWPWIDPIHSPAFVVAATNRNLQEAVQAGSFRHDLYYRFRYRLRVPPLRERRSDLGVLVDFVLQDPSINPLRSDRKHEVEHIARAALEKLEHYAFPGNYRELEDLLSRAVFNALRSGRRTILAEDLDHRVH